MGPTGESGTLRTCIWPPIDSNIPKEILNYMAIITTVCLIPWCLLNNNVGSCLSTILQALLRAQYSCRTDGSYLSRMCTPDLCPSSMDKYALTCAMEVQRATPIDTLSLLIHTTYEMHSNGSAIELLRLQGQQD